jgi:hypothetical protein
MERWPGRSGRDETIWVVIEMCMEAMLGISLYSYLYLKRAITLCFSFSLLCLLFNKTGEEGQTGSAWKWRRVKGEGGHGGWGGRHSGERWPKQCMHIWINEWTIKKEIISWEWPPPATLRRTKALGDKGNGPHLECRGPLNANDYVRTQKLFTIGQALSSVSGTALNR